MTQLDAGRPGWDDGGVLLLGESPPVGRAVIFPNEVIV